MKRILFVHHGKGIGGAPLTLRAIIRALDRSKFSPCVLCLFESEAAELFRNDGIETRIAKHIYHLAHTTGIWYPLYLFPIFLFRLLLFPVSVWNAHRFLKENHFDIVHLNSSSLLAVAVAAKLHRIPVLTHILEHLHPGYLGIRRFLFARLLVAFSDTVVFICNADIHAFPSSPKLHVVYDSIDPDEFNLSNSTGSVASSLTVPKDAQVVGMLGGIQPIKGTLEFVNAAAQIVRQLPNTHFIILGVLPEKKRHSTYSRSIDVMRGWLSGARKYRSHVLGIAGQESLKGKIHLVGSVLDVPSYLAMFNVLVFPSTTPHYARPLIEAGLMKKPVVASRIGGPEEIVSDGVTGFLVTPKEPDELARRIIQLLNDRKLSAQMGEAGYKRALDIFDQRKNVPEIIKFYNKISR